jgi:DNA-directed RNA polymerase beta subunit
MLVIIKQRNMPFQFLKNIRRKYCRKNWPAGLETNGKMQLFDGRTGEAYDQKSVVGIGYILKLVHMVDDKVHAVLPVLTLSLLSNLLEVKPEWEVKD